MSPRQRSCAAPVSRSITSRSSSGISPTSADADPAFPSGPAPPAPAAPPPDKWGGGFLTGLKVVVDGSGLERPRAGVGVYTSEIVRALAVDRPDCRLTVFGPRSAWVHVPNATYRLLPRTRLIGRHLQWPAQIRELKPEAYFGPAR